MEVFAILICVVLEVQILTAANTSASNVRAWSPTSSTEQEYAESCPSNGSLTCSAADSCPPGLFCNKERLCECANTPSNIISCNGTSSFLYKHLCATYYNNETVVGVCPFAYVLSEINQLHSTPSLRYELPQDIHRLTELLCNSTNRTGTLCGQCLPDHYPLAYSFNMTCIPCPHVRWNWFRYIMAAYLPLTVFCLLVLFFQINTTSSHLFAVVYYCQTLTLFVPLQVINLNYISYLGSSYIMAAKVLLSLYGIWSLDFFRPFYTDLCLGIGTLPAIALDYVIAAYPLILTFITYLLIALYDNKYRVVRIAWKPFSKLLSIFKKNWDARTSLIDAFATFFFLSNYKFLMVSFNILTPTKLYHIFADHHHRTLGVYLSSDSVYFGKEHLPYAILALVILCAFVLLPLLVLILYPTAIFHKILNLFPFRWYILHTFIDSFQGCYKDGTQPGTRDCRWFSSAFLISRICILVLYTLTNDSRTHLLISSMLLMVYISLIATLQPFKASVSHYNIINSILFLFLGLFMLCICGYNIAVFVEPHLVLVFASFAAVLAALPLLYMLGITSTWLYKHRRFGLSVLRLLRAWRSDYVPIAESDSGVPDRIESPNSYHSRNLASFVTHHAVKS